MVDRPVLKFWSATIHGFVNGTVAVCDQTSKFFVSHREESMAGPVGVKGVY
jgi:hypothetical protein